MGKARNIIFIVADSLRYDSVYRDGCRHSGLNYTENNAVSFHQARSSGCWTLPATSCLFTGKMPHEHQATTQSRNLSKKYPTLAEQLKAAGYNTYQVSANVVTTDIFGLDRGFDEVHKVWETIVPRFNKIYQVYMMLGKPRIRKMLFSKDAVRLKLAENIKNGNVWGQTSFMDVFDISRKILEQNEAENKGSFIFINLMETHFPYHIDDTLKFSGKNIFANFAEAWGLYNIINQTFLKKEGYQLKPPMMEKIRNRQYKSWEIIRDPLDDFIREQHENKDNLVVFCSDHGDNFGEHNWVYHFSNVSDAGNRVPILWCDHEHQQKSKIDTPVSSRYLYNDILKAAGLNNEGHSLFMEEAVNLPILQSYWYNNDDKTLDKFRNNQFCFVEEGNRYLYKHNSESGWAISPITIEEQEKEFEQYGAGNDPIEEIVKDRERKEYLAKAFREFKDFSSTVI